MSDKTPKADRLREQREARYDAEQVRQKAEVLRLKEAETIAVKMRGKAQKVDDMAAVASMASRLGRRR